MKTKTNNNYAAMDLLRQAIDRLSAAAISTPQLDSIIILEDALGVDRAHLLAHPELTTTAKQYARYRDLLEKRQRHIPLAYLRGKAMFYGRTFIVDENVLIPRPESEDSIELLKKYLPRSDISIADVGTGSGCLGITAALELSIGQAPTLDLYDISPKALKVARSNALSFRVKARFFHEDLLKHAVARKYDVVLANLPYVPESYPVNLDAQFEPNLALFAGSDGLHYYRLFWQQLADFFSPHPLYVITESLDTQHKVMEELAVKAGYIIAETRSLTQCFKLLVGRSRAKSYA